MKLFWPYITERLDFFSDIAVCKMASSGSPMLRHLFNSLVKRVTEVSREEEEYNDCPRDRSYSVTSTDSGYCEGSSLQGQKWFRKSVLLFFFRMHCTDRCD